MMQEYVPCVLYLCALCRIYPKAKKMNVISDPFRRWVSFILIATTNITKRTRKLFRVSTQKRETNIKEHLTCSNPKNRVQTARSVDDGPEEALSTGRKSGRAGACMSTSVMGDIEQPKHELTSRRVNSEPCG
jgi:hypothetical protein